jgi:hypothetical protein
LGPGVSTGPRYVWQLLFIAKKIEIVYYSSTTKAREKNTDLESLEFEKYFDESLTKFKNN